MITIRMLMFSLTVFLLTTDMAQARTQLGSGGVTCGNYLKLKQIKPAERTAIESWILGLLSGLNYSRYLIRKGDLLSDKDPDQVLAWVSNHCEKNPQKDIGSATLDYWIFLLASVKE